MTLRLLCLLEAAYFKRARLRLLRLLEAANLKRARLRLCLLEAAYLKPVRFICYVC